MKNLYTCRKLSAEEVIKIYSDTAVLHFPKAELKPVNNVKSYLEKGLYMGYGFFENERLLAYALFLTLPKERRLLLDYYAVLQEYRNGGIGSAFLQSLKQTLSCAGGIYIESENPEYAKDRVEQLIREKRIDFYLRNGAVITNVLSTLFQVPYRILYLPLLSIEEKNTEIADPISCVSSLPCPKSEGQTAPPDPNKGIDFYEDIDLIYHAMFPPDVYERNVVLCHGRHDSP